MSGERILDNDVKSEMEDSFLEYSMSVITSRALPDVRDGLKPVHRRIVFNMNDQGIRSNVPHKKCAKVVGDVMGRLHPHGDCLDGETLIMGADGTTHRLVDLYTNSVSELEVFATTKDGSYTTSRAHSFRIGQYATTIYNIALSKGGTVKATGNHPFRLSGGAWVKAENLVVGDVLASAYYPSVNNEVSIEGSINRISGIEVETLLEPVPMYDFTVDEHENLFIATSMREDGDYELTCVHNSAIYEALVRMAQDFYMRIPLVDGHGNFGSLGQEDPAAASRYTECRMTEAAMHMMQEINEDSVDWKPTYDGSENEPTVLPATFPNLLVNGGSGIAVGMATNIPTHNIEEVTRGCVALLENPDITLDEMMQIVPGPDFPTAGLIIGKDGIREAYETGRGSFKIRSKTEIGQISARKKGITITELPYGVGPEGIIKRIKELVNQKKLLGVSDVNDYTGRKTGGVKVIVEVKTGFNAEAVLEELFRTTNLEVSFGVNAVALVKGQPRTLGLIPIMGHFNNHRLEVTTRRSKFRKRKAEQRAHIIEGIVIALAHIEEVVATIKASKSTGDARGNLMKQYVLSEIQADEILAMPLRRLVSLEVQKLEDELAELHRIIADLTALLADPARMKQLIIDELSQTARVFATPRKSQILGVAPVSNAAAVEIEDTPCIIALSATGLIGRFPAPRTGRVTRADIVVSEVATTARATVGAITSTGRLLKLSAVEIPEADGKSRGGAVKEFFQLNGDEEILHLTALNEKNMFLMATRQGAVKKLLVSALTNKPIAPVIGLKDGDQLVGVAEVDAEFTGDVILVSSAAQLLRTSSENIPAKGAPAGGIAGMKLGEEANVIAFGVASDEALVYTVSDTNGGKVSLASEYPAKGRGGAGMRCQTLKKTETALSFAYVGTTPEFLSEKNTVAFSNTPVKRDSSATVELEEVIIQVGTKRS